MNGPTETELAKAVWDALSPERQRHILREMDRTGRWDPTYDERCLIRQLGHEL